MIFLANAFSLQMVQTDQYRLAIKTVSTNEVANRLQNETWVSCVGHTDIAAVAGDMLGMEVQYNRGNISLREGDTMFVAQVIGGRLPEGATKLPNGYTIVWKQVEIINESKPKTPF